MFLHLMYAVCGSSTGVVHLMHLGFALCMHSCLMQDCRSALCMVLAVSDSLLLQALLNISQHIFTAAAAVPAQELSSTCKQRLELIKPCSKQLKEDILQGVVHLCRS